MAYFYCCKMFVIFKKNKKKSLELKPGCNWFNRMRELKKMKKRRSQTRKPALTRFATRTRPRARMPARPPAPACPPVSACVCAPACLPSPDPCAPGPVQAVSVGFSAGSKFLGVVLYYTKVIM